MHPEDDWGYSDGEGCGPSEWTKQWKSGKAQSPIDILVEACDLHQTACCGCSLSQRIQSELLISRPTSGNRTTNNKLPVQRYQQLTHGRRLHLDSTGDDDIDSDRPRSSSALSSSSAELARPFGLSGDSDRSATPSDGSPNLERSRAERNETSRSSLPPARGVAQKQATRYCSTNKKIFLGYPRYLNSIELCNTGHTWQVSMPPELANHTLLSGPPLGDCDYRLAQFHCHWGETCNSGSEHRINGRSFAAEIHFVHWNCTDHESFEEASKHKHGLVVLGVLVQALEDEQYRNKHLDKIISSLHRVRKPNSTAQINEARLDLKKLFPSNRWNYATYEGSLTTPPLLETVDWLVFLQPIQCSASQVAEFRRIECSSGAMFKNCRPVQQLNGRTVTLWTHAHHSPNHHHHHQYNNHASNHHYSHNHK